MFLAIVRLLFDVALVVLIWMIQRVVYPGFLHYTTANLVVWHKKYVDHFRPIVLPLMLGQLGLVVYQTVSEPSVYAMVSLAVVVFLWLITFWWFVPVHLNISKGEENINKKMLHRLIAKNRIRTILWTLLFMYSLFETYYLLH